MKFFELPLLGLTIFLLTSSFFSPTKINNSPSDTPCTDDCGSEADALFQLDQDALGMSWHEAREASNNYYKDCIHDCLGIDD